MGVMKTVKVGLCGFAAFGASQTAAATPETLPRGGEALQVKEYTPPFETQSQLGLTALNSTPATALQTPPRPLNPERIRQEVTDQKSGREYFCGRNDLIDRLEGGRRPGKISVFKADFDRLDTDPRTWVRFDTCKGRGIAPLRRIIWNVYGGMSYVFANRDYPQIGLVVNSVSGAPDKVSLCWSPTNLITGEGSNVARCGMVSVALPLRDKTYRFGVIAEVRGGINAIKGHNPPLIDRLDAQQIEQLAINSGATILYGKEGKRQP